MFGFQQFDYSKPTYGFLCIYYAWDVGFLGSVNLSLVMENSEPLFLKIFLLPIFNLLPF